MASQLRKISSLLDVPKSTVQDTIKKFCNHGTTKNLQKSGRPRSISTSKNIKMIKMRVHRNSRLSMRKVARDTGISATTVRRIAKNELGLKPYKLQKAQLLTEKTKKVRLERCKLLLQWHACPDILFTDEKIFTIEAVHNHQNDRIWTTESPLSDKLITHSQHPQSVMVWAGICASGKTPLIFVDPGVKINKDYYLREILQRVVKPWAESHFGRRVWIFQQDSAPAHKAPAHSVWSILESRVCAKPHKSLESLRHSLIREWDLITLKEVRAICENFSSRLRLCIKAKGGHFETS
uniref:Transposase n=1 Tax=Meloidogyne incognita TaxID=6306 RepID=A0A914KM83_MELIC